MVLFLYLNSVIVKHAFHRNVMIKLKYSKKQQKEVIPSNRKNRSEDSRKCFTQVHWHNRCAYTSAKERKTVCEQQCFEWFDRHTFSNLLIEEKSSVNETERSNAQLSLAFCILLFSLYFWQLRISYLNIQDACACPFLMAFTDMKFLSSFWYIYYHGNCVIKYKNLSILLKLIDCVHDSRKFWLLIFG